MHAVIHSVVLQPDFQFVDVETIVFQRGLPTVKVLGGSGKYFKESVDRARVGLNACAVRMASKKTILHLEGAELSQQNRSIELGIVASLFEAHKRLSIPKKLLNQTCFLGEVHLDGTITPVNLTDAHRETLQSRYTYIVGSMTPIPTLGYYPVQSVDALQHLKITEVEMTTQPFTQLLRFSSVYPAIYETLKIGVASRQHMLLLGPVGMGKTSCIRAIQELNPSQPELLTVHPHSKRLLETISSSSHDLLIELNELRSFTPQLLHQVAIIMDPVFQVSQYHRTIVATSNECPCGWFGSTNCSCDPSVRKQYLRPLKGHLLDRFGIQIRFPTSLQPVSIEEQILLEKIESDASHIRSYWSSTQSIPRTDHISTQQYMERKGISLRKRGQFLTIVEAISVFYPDKSIEERIQYAQNVSRPILTGTQ